MLSVLGRRVRLCDGLTRRELLRVGGLFLFAGMTLPHLLRAGEAKPLVSDLEERGLLASTLVVVMGEMGRSPRVNRKAGRDHWPQCGFSLLFGGGVRGGIVHGASDRIGAYPVSHAVSPADFVATIYHLLGIDPDRTVPDHQGRPIPIAHGGQPIYALVS